MANPEHLDILKQGVEAWNQWRNEHTDILYPNLSGANLTRAILCRARLTYANLSHADLSHANLSESWLNGANLSGTDLTSTFLMQAEVNYANLSGANLSGANLAYASLGRTNLSGVDLRSANLSRVDLRSANLSRAYLIGADLTEADLSGANLSGADLSSATLVRTNLTGATLTNCHIYGIAAWSVELKGATQNDLVVTPDDEPTIAVDNLEVAQFIYLLLNNPKLREVIDTIARKAILILGRFTPERKAVLDALRKALRTYGYVPILFDFDKPASRDLTGTISTLAHLARFIIVDLTDPSSAPHEVATVIPQTVVPVQPVILDGEREYSMFRDLRQRYHWVLPTYSYTDQAHLLATLQEHVIAPAEQKAQELEKR